jgi:hypothetical protein
MRLLFLEIYKTGYLAYREHATLQIRCPLSGIPNYNLKTLHREDHSYPLPRMHWTDLLVWALGTFTESLFILNAVYIHVGSLQNLEHGWKKVAMDCPNGKQLTKVHDKRTWCVQALNIFLWPRPTEYLCGQQWHIRTYSLTWIYKHVRYLFTGELCVQRMTISELSYQEQRN